MRWLTILFSAQSHHSHVLCHVLCFLVGGSANGKREEERREGEEGGRGGKERRRRKERKVRRKGDSD